MLSSASLVFLLNISMFQYCVPTPGLCSPNSQCGCRHTSCMFATKRTAPSSFNLWYGSIFFLLSSPGLCWIPGHFFCVSRWGVVQCVHLLTFAFHPPIFYVSQRGIVPVCFLSAVFLSVASSGGGGSPVLVLVFHGLDIAFWRRGEKGCVHETYMAVII